MKYNITENGINFLKHLEGVRLTAYLDTAGIWTIGYGMTRYSTGIAVKKGDTISLQKAEDGLLSRLNSEIVLLNKVIVNSQLNSNMFDALVCFAYNVGNTAFTDSTLLKLVNVNPIDPNISHEFTRWVHVQKQVVDEKTGKPVLRMVEDIGLKNRQKQTSDYYFMIP